MLKTKEENSLCANCGHHKNFHLIAEPERCLYGFTIGEKGITTDGCKCKKFVPIPKEKELEYKWKEIIDTSNNQDPKYSFELFKGILEQENQKFQDALKKLEEDKITLNLKMNGIEGEFINIKELNKLKEIK